MAAYLLLVVEMPEGIMYGDRYFIPDVQHQDRVRCFAEMAQEGMSERLPSDVKVYPIEVEVPDVLQPE